MKEYKEGRWLQKSQFMGPLYTLTLAAGCWSLTCG